MRLYDHFGRDDRLGDCFLALDFVSSNPSSDWIMAKKKEKEKAMVFSVTLRYWNKYGRKKVRFMTYPIKKFVITPDDRIILYPIKLK